ncbi:porphobilinogen synthase [Candidatus Endowatersipora endosymbiont of Watersipora subatra]|uniref:porphobilinogen synthase n=1 Tax=Candidatus Endowatersipora endosymbiont of Watersipora subatra TaxID=3077946 RepID=UPI00312C9404
MSQTKLHFVKTITTHRRLRRNRIKDWIRRLIREHRLSVDDLILPLFIIDGVGIEEPIPSMPGISRYSIDKALEVVYQAADLNIPAVTPFPNISLELKDEKGSEVTNPDNLICRFTSKVKNLNLNIGIITDAALDPFTNHGHDGILRNGIIVNDESVKQIVKGAVIQAQAGADIIAPSDMMDGRIGAIRKALDANGFQNVGIISYAAKYASAFYGPYRQAIGTEGLLQGDKKTYYIDPANTEDAMREAKLDIEEGADMLMVKPGMPYLDIVWRMKSTFHMPVSVYQVSGEYVMIKNITENRFIDENSAMLESLIAFKRAGADNIFTYFALKAARLLYQEDR